MHVDENDALHISVEEIAERIALLWVAGDDSSFEASQYIIHWTELVSRADGGDADAKRIVEIAERVMKEGGFGTITPDEDELVFEYVDEQGLALKWPAFVVAGIQTWVG